LKPSFENLKLKDISKIYSGNSINEKIKEQKYTGLENGVEYISTKDISFNSEISYDNGVKIPFNELDNFKTAPTNTVFICAEGGSAGRKLAISDRELCFVNKLFAVVASELVLPKYLFYSLKTEDFIEQFNGSMTGIIGGVSLNKFRELEIKVPSISIQQKIVAKLDEIFAEIDTATAAAEANADNAEALFKSYLTEVFERGGEGWKTKKLCDVSSFDKHQGIHTGIPYIGMENIQSHTTQLINGVDLVEEVKSSTFKFSDTHLLYGRLRPYLNKVYAPDFIGHCSTEIFPIKPFSNLLRAYLKYWFINVKTVDRINATCTGARMPRANMNAVMDFDFPLPPISIQKQLIEYFDSVQNFTHIAIDSYKAKIAEITALKQSILQRAFSGELVKD